MYIQQKTQDLGLALIKIATQIRRRELRSRIEDLTFDLIERSASGDWEEVLLSLEVISSLVGFGRLIYQIEPVNAKILEQSINNLSAQIRQNTVLDIGSLSNEDTINKTNSFAQTQSEAANGNNQAINSAIGNGYGNAEESGNHIGNGNGNGISGTIRQSAIIDKIKQVGRASLKDLLIDFPDVSERTIRYDIQKLCTQGILERIGNGGPSTYYIAKL